MITPYLRFIHLRESIDGFYDLSPIQHFIIKKLFLMWGHRANITVTDVMALNEIASSSTMHRQLIDLKEKGYIIFKNNPLDNRIKQVLPTKKLNKIQAAFEKAFMDAISIHT